MFFVESFQVVTVRHRQTLRINVWKLSCPVIIIEVQHTSCLGVEKIFMETKFSLATLGLWNDNFLIAPQALQGHQKFWFRIWVWQSIYILEIPTMCERFSTLRLLLAGNRAANISKCQSWTVVFSKSQITPAFCIFTALSSSPPPCWPACAYWVWSSH